MNLSPVDNVFWTVSVKNDRKEQVLVVWDEISFIGGNGVSRGRLIRGKTRVIHDAQVQPSTPIAPGAMVIEFVVPENLKDYRPTDQRVAGKQQQQRGEAPPVVELNPAPPDVTEGVGRMLLTFITADGRQLWEATMYLEGNAPPPVKKAPAAGSAAAAASGQGVVNSPPADTEEPPPGPR